MKSLGLAALAILCATGAGLAASPDRLSDGYFECVLGKGGVAMLHGASPGRALKLAEAACKDSIKAIFDAYGSEGDVGALLTHDHEVAAGALAAMKVGLPR